MENVALDEQRHIGFGVKLLADLCREDPDCKQAVADMLREVIPYTAAVLVPPGWDRRYTEVFGFTLEEIGAEGAASLETKLRSAGLPMEELPGPPIFSPGMEPMERAKLGQQLVYGGILGEKTGPPRRDPDTMQAIFQMLLGGLDQREAPERAGHDPVGLRRRRAVAPRGGQRRHARRAGRAEAPDRDDPVPLRGLGRPARRPRARLKLAALRRLRPGATCAGCGGRGGCSRASRPESSVRAHLPGVWPRLTPPAGTPMLRHRLIPRASSAPPSHSGS